MEQKEIKNFKIDWVEHEMVGLQDCPLCGYNRDNLNYAFSVYAFSVGNDKKTLSECPNCHARFFIEQTIKLFQVIGGD